MIFLNTCNYTIIKRGSMMIVFKSYKDFMAIKQYKNVKQYDSHTKRI